VEKDVGIGGIACTARVISPNDKCESDVMRTVEYPFFFVYVAITVDVMFTLVRLFIDVSV